MDVFIIYRLRFHNNRLRCIYPQHVCVCARASACFINSLKICLMLVPNGAKQEGITKQQYRSPVCYRLVRGERPYKVSAAGIDMQQPTTLSTTHTITLCIYLIQFLLLILPLLRALMATSDSKQCRRIFTLLLVVRTLYTPTQ